MNYSKYVSDTFDDVVESDFNPDVILDGMQDCYAVGVGKGFVVGVTFCGIIALVKRELNGLTRRFKED